MKLDRFIGQDHVRDRLRLAVDAARVQQQACPHVLLSGPPGLGKTTLARLVADAMGSTCHQTSGPALSDDKSIIGVLRNVKAGDVLFVDEIHRLPVVAAERLYPVMEEFIIELVMGEGVFARAKRAKVPLFTLIGATTHPGLLPRPLRDRFKVNVSLSLYEPTALHGILAGLATEAEEEGLALIAERSRGTPRIAKSLLDAARAVAVTRCGGRITKWAAEEAMRVEGVDAAGLNELDRRYLRVLIDHYRGGPAGIAALSAAMGEDVRNLSDVVEPFLLQQGFVARRKQGRCALVRAYDHLGIPMLPQDVPAVAVNEEIL